MKTLAKILILVILLTSLSTLGVLAELEPIKVIVNGEEIKFDVEPTIIKERTLVPVRAIFEKLGLKVEWDSETKTVIGRNEDLEIRLPIGNKKAIKNGKELELDTPATIINGRTLVPLRFVAECTGAEVKWDGTTRTVTIIKEDNREYRVSLNGQILEDVRPIKIIDGIKYIPFKPLIYNLNLGIVSEEKGKYIKVMGDYSEIELRAGDTNTIDYTLNVPPKVIDGEFYVPQDFLNAPELSNTARAELGLWDTEGNLFSLIAIEKSNSNDSLLNTLKQKISYVYDIRYFTLYAFMNYTGYDDENNNDGFSEVRKMVREDLRNMNLKLSDNNYYRNKDVEYQKYEKALKEMGNPPNFEYIGDKGDVTDEIKDLNKHLKEFYKKANIDELYEKYRSYHEKELEKYKHVVETEIPYTIEYLKLDINEIPDFYIQVNLLDAYERGSGMGSEDIILGKGIMTGPCYKPNKLNIVHEFLHGIINPILDDLGESDKDEDFVRALSAMIVYRYGDGGKSIIDNQVGRGYKMAGYIYERFNNDWENYNGSLKDFVKEIIENY